MKLKLEESIITLIPEGFNVQLYLVMFAKKLEQSETWEENRHFNLMFDRSTEDERECGNVDKPSMVIDCEQDLLDEQENSLIKLENLITTKDITGLEISYFHL